MMFPNPNHCSRQRENTLVTIPNALNPPAALEPSDISADASTNQLCRSLSLHNAAELIVLS